MSLDYAEKVRRALQAPAPGKGLKASRQSIKSQLRYFDTMARNAYTSTQAEQWRRLAEELCDYLLGPAALETPAN